MGGVCNFADAPHIDAQKAVLLFFSKAALRMHLPFLKKLVKTQV